MSLLDCPRSALMYNPPMTDIHVLTTIPFSDPQLERIQAASPLIKLHTHPSRSAEQIPDDILAITEVLYTLTALPDPEKMPQLKWIQFHFAGIDHATDHPLLGSGAVVTTLSGAGVPQLSEFAVMHMLALGHQLHKIIRSAPEEQWAEGRNKRFLPQELRGSTVGIVGYGSIGREIARLVRSFGAEVLAIKRNLMELEDRGYQLDGMGDPGAEIPRRIYPPEALGSMVAECDFVVVTVPLNRQTQNMINETIFKSMKSSAYLIDISRGGVVNQDDLLAALAAGELAGAALDVFPEEPLPVDSPLWSSDQLILTPHISGNSPHYLERASVLFAENLRRYVSGRPLINEFDFERGY